MEFLDVTMTVTVFFSCVRDKTRSMSISVQKNATTGLYDIHENVDGLSISGGEGMYRVKKELVKGNKPFPTEGDYTYLPVPIHEMSKSGAYGFLQAPFADLTSGKYKGDTDFALISKDYPMPEGWCLTKDQIDPCPTNICCATFSAAPTESTVKTESTVQTTAPETEKKVVVSDSSQQVWLIVLIAVIVIILIVAFFASRKPLFAI